MNRRDFLGAASLGLMGAGLAGAAERRASLPEFTCGTRPREELRAVRMSLATGSLTIAGTRLFKEGFLDELLPLYERSTGRRAQMQGGGCGDGVTGVRTGTAQLGCLCCPVTESPARGMRWLQVAWDMKVVVAHPGVASDGVTSTQLHQVLAGELLNWRSLGGPDHPIALVINDHCPDFVEPVRKIVLGNRPIWSAAALVTKTDQKQLETTARFEHSIGVNSWILAEPFVKAGRLKVLALDGVPPTLADAAAGRYRLLGPMNMIFKEWSPVEMASLFAMIYGKSGREILARRVVPVTAEQAAFPPRIRA